MKRLLIFILFVFLTQLSLHAQIDRRNIPPPRMYILGKDSVRFYGGVIDNKVSLAFADGLKIDAGEFSKGFITRRYSVVKQSNGLTIILAICQGGGFTPKVKEIFKRMKYGDKIIISDILIDTVDGIARIMPPFEIEYKKNNKHILGIFMRTKSFFAWGLSFLGLALGSSNACAQSESSNLVLVSSTNFGVVGAKDNLFNSIDLVNDFEGVYTPQITIGEGYALTPDAVSSYSEGTFLSGQYYGISYDSKALDTLRFADNDDNWGIVFSTGSKNLSATIPLFSYKVNGLKNGGKYRVVVETCNPLNEDYLNASSALSKSCRSNGGPSLSGGYNDRLKVGVNNKMFGAGMDTNVPITAGNCEASSVTSPTSANSNLGFITDGTLNVNVYMVQGVSYSAVKIKSVKVYAELNPQISGKTSDCVGGKNVTFKLNDKYNNCTYQWYKDGVKIAGATGSAYTHTTGNIEGKEYEFYCEISTANGEKLKSNTLKFEDKACSVDNDGTPMDEKLIWQDDFGTFTEEGKYWVWDYSDINNPQKVMKTTTDGWTYELPYTIPGAEYASPVYAEGTYSVAANVTSSHSGATTGTLWEWQAYTFYGKIPSDYGKSYAPDHTESMENSPEGYGAMLFLNCGNNPNTAIYSRTFEELCNREYTAKCYFSTFTDSPNPVKLQLRLTDMNSNVTVVSDTITRYSTGYDDTEYDVQTAWSELSATITLTGTKPGLKLEIISVGGGDSYNEMGNDLILDDIQLWSCSMPSVELSVEDNMLHVVETPMIQNYYKNDAAYIYQYTFDDPSTMSFDKNSWKPVPGSKITSDGVFSDISKVFMDKDAKDTAYFRVILGNEETLVSFGLDYSYNANEVCSIFSVSDPVAITLPSTPICDLSDVAFRTPSAAFCEGAGDGKVDLTLTKGEASDYTIHWWYGTDTITGTRLGDDKTSAFFEGLTIAESGTYIYQIEELSTGCVGDIHNFDVTVTYASNVEAIAAESKNDVVNVYSETGALVKANIKRSEALNGLANGAYVVGGEKVVVKK